MEVKPIVVYDLECRMALEPVQANQPSSGVELRYTEIFLIPALTSVSF